MTNVESVLFDGLSAWVKLAGEAQPRIIGHAEGVSAAQLMGAKCRVEISANGIVSAASAWVPVTEDLPGPDDLVLVSTAKGDVCACMYCPGYDDDEPGRWTAGEWPVDDVVAWRPLPTPWVKP